MLRLGAGLTAIPLPVDVSEADAAARGVRLGRAQRHSPRCCPAFSREWRFDGDLRPDRRVPSAGGPGAQLLGNLSDSEGPGSGVPYEYDGRFGRVLELVLVEDEVGLGGVPGEGLVGVLQTR